MGKWLHLSLLVTCFVITGCNAGKNIQAADRQKETVRIVKVKPTPEPDNVSLNVVFPKKNQVISSQPIDLQMRLRGYPLGTNSDFARRLKLYDDPQGQSVRIFIDDLPYFSIYRSFIDSLDDNNIYYELTLTKKIPYQLDSGMHIIRAFPVRSYGESLKGPGTFAGSVFYIGNKTSQTVNWNAPFITYNEPQGSYYSYDPEKPILLDFYLSNVRLSQDGYKVRITIDDSIKRLLIDWVPYYIYGLAAGDHKIRLELLDSNNQLVPGPFNDVQKTFTLK